MIRKATELIRQYEMLSPCDFVVAGVSGGADSLALLHFLRFGLAQWNLNLRACHVNHLLRGEESLRDQQHVEAICRAWGVELTVCTVDVAAVAASQKCSVEEAGRQERYRIFTELAGANGKIATAHTLSDRYETMLFHLARGTGLKGLCAIPPVRDRIIRPLLSVSRDEVECYCRENGIAYVTDSSNFDPAYSRNKIRHEVIPALSQINPNALAAASRTFALLEEDAAALDHLAATQLAAARRQDRLWVSKLDPTPAIRNRVLRQWLEEQGITVDYETIQRLVAIFDRGGKQNLVGNRFFEVVDGVARITEIQPPTPSFSFSPVWGEQMQMPSGETYTFLLADSEKMASIQEIFTDSTYNYIDSAKIVGKLVIRQRQDGDRICIFPRNITKSIKKLFNEAKLPVEMRDKRFLLCDERGVIYVEGFGCDRRVAPQKDTASYLVMIRRSPQADRKEMTI